MVSNGPSPVVFFPTVEIGANCCLHISMTKGTHSFDALNVFRMPNKCRLCPASPVPCTPVPCIPMLSYVDLDVILDRAAPNQGRPAHLQKPMI
jgi:hypothetical protein